MNDAKKKEKHPLQKLLEALDDGDCKLRSYSGRAMYGKECLGIVVHQPSTALSAIVDACLNHAEDMSRDDREDVIRGVGSYRTDNMGLDMIVYFPQVHFVDDEEDTDDDEEGEDE